MMTAGTEKIKIKQPENIVFLLWLLIFLLLFLISSKLFFRLDLTANKANTLSPYSKMLSSNLDEPLIISYFVSDRLARAHPLPGEINDLLTEYASNSNGMIRFSKKDPQKENLLREMEILGIMPSQMQVSSNNETSWTNVYSGIMLEYLDRTEILPSVFSIDNLEYDITSKIISLTQDKKRELGVISRDASRVWEYEFNILDQELLRAGFSIRQIGFWEEIPHDLYCLLVFGGAEELDEWELYCIDHFIQSGGNVFFAAGGVKLDFEEGFDVRPANDQRLLAMLSYYGITVQKALVLDTACLNVSFQTENAYFHNEITTLRYPLWPEISSHSGNPDHPVSAGFQGLDLYWASPLELKTPSGVEAVPLFSSTKDAWLQTKEFVTSFDRYQFFDNEKEKTTGEKILGASLSGFFPPGFGDYPENPIPSKIIVVGNTDFAGSLMSATMAENRNTDFLIRSALWLGGEEELIALRKNRSEILRLDKIQDQQKKENYRNFSLALNVVIIPVLVIISGLVIAKIRRRVRN